MAVTVSISDKDGVMTARPSLLLTQFVQEVEMRPDCSVSAIRGLTREELPVGMLFGDWKCI